jgi:dUTP pyrophosphatase
MSVFAGGTTDHAMLYLYIDGEDNELISMYSAQIEKHNSAVISDPYPNAGFDLLCPRDETFHSCNSKMIDYRVKAEMRIYNASKESWTTTGFYMYPRSSISKTPLLLANHVGIIDSGYRGWLMGAFRLIGLSPPIYSVDKYTRLLQICSPDLRPIYVKLVQEPFFEETARGGGGFGSTGV